MKTRSKFVMSMVTALMLLTVLIGAGPVDQVKAEAAENDLLDRLRGDPVFKKIDVAAEMEPSRFISSTASGTASNMARRRASLRRSASRARFCSVIS